MKVERSPGIYGFMVDGGGMDGLPLARQVTRVTVGMIDHVIIE